MITNLTSELHDMIDWLDLSAKNTPAGTLVNFPEEIGVLWADGTLCL
jgi:hypothetical protein